MNPVLISPELEMDSALDSKDEGVLMNRVLLAGNIIKLEMGSA